MWTNHFQMFKLDLEKTEEPETKLPTSIGSLKKQESSRKTSTFALFDLKVVQPVNPKGNQSWIYNGSTDA